MVWIRADAAYENSGTSLPSGDLVPAATAGPVTNQAEIDEHRNNDCDEVKPFDGMVRIHDPRIDDGGHWQENEADDDEQQRMISPLEKIREEEKQDDRYSGKREGQQQQQARQIGRA